MAVCLALKQARGGGDDCIVEKLNSASRGSCISRYDDGEYIGAFMGKCVVPWWPGLFWCLSIIRDDDRCCLREKSEEIRISSIENPPKRPEYRWSSHRNHHRTGMMKRYSIESKRPRRSPLCFLWYSGWRMRESYVHEVLLNFQSSIK